MKARYTQAELLLILLVCDLLQPIHRLAALFFSEGDVGHRGRGCGSMPVFFSSLEPDHIAGPNLFDQTAFVLGPPTSSRNNEGLTEWMSMPCRSGARLECDHGAANACRLGRLERLIDANNSSEPLGWPLG